MKRLSLPKPRHHPNKVGRPSFLKNDVQSELVLRLAASGARKSEIARMMAIAPPTLRKHFDEELRRGAFLANAVVARTMLRIATDINHPKVFEAARFWLEHRAGWYPPGSVCRRCGEAIRSRSSF
ncbi:MAG: hypothetical protein Q8M31_19160 [Beijerinckiaceae bacterium]|nr:hypothetical protein [Beijerinckiaceae bacterium]